MIRAIRLAIASMVAAGALGAVMLLRWALRVAEEEYS